MTLEEIKIKLAHFNCCASAIAYQLMRAEQAGSSDCQELECKLHMLIQGIGAIERYLSTFGEYNDDYSEDYFI